MANYKNIEEKNVALKVDNNVSHNSSKVNNNHRLGAINEWRPQIGGGDRGMCERMWHQWDVLF